MHEQTTGEFSYTGTKALENMTAAVNYNRTLLGLILRTYPLSGESRILDFGAGVGTFSKLMREKGYSPECVEIDRAECNELRNAGFTVFEGLQTVPDNAYDLIYSLNVLEHIEDHVGVLREVRKKLKPGGKLLIFVPAFQLLYSDFDAMLGHHRRYQMRDLKAVLEAGGLQIEKIRYFDSVGFFAAYVFKLLRAKPEEVTKGKIWFFDRIVFPVSLLCDLILHPFFGKNLYTVCSKGEGK